MRVGVDIMTTITAENITESIKEGQELQASSANNTDDNLSQVVSFRLAKEEYGLNIMSVQEIILMGEITQIPEVPPYVRGLINLRGKVIPILDLRIRFGMETTQSNEHTRIIVVNSESYTIGIVVDAVNQVLRIESDQIEPPPKGLSGIDQAYLSGLVKMEEKIMILLNIDKIMSEEEHETINKQKG